MTKHYEEHAGWKVGDVAVNNLGRELTVIGIVEWHPNKVDIHYRYSDDSSFGSRAIEATEGWRRVE